MTAFSNIPLFAALVDANRFNSVMPISYVPSSKHMCMTFRDLGYAHKKAALYKNAGRYMKTNPLSTKKYKVYISYIVYMV